LSSLESRKSDLEKKLSELQGKPAGSQTAEEHNTEENDTELTVVGYQPEQI
jgi:hypothetical protein